VVIRAALYGTILIAVGTWVVTLTGDPAIDDIKQNAWYQKEVVEAHEEAGDKINILAIVAGVAAIATLVLARGARPLRRAFSAVTLLLIVFAAMCAAWAAWEGGKIRHTEFGTGTPPATGTS
jgi:hypothetical protein